MLFRIIWGALVRQKRRSFLIGLTMALGISLATAMLIVVFGVSDQVNRELKAFGANIVVTQKTTSLAGDLFGESGEPPVERFLEESDVGKVKTIFWANNIVDFAPYLEASLVLKTTGTPGLTPSVPVVGTWFSRDVSLPTGDSVRTGIRSLKSWWTVTGDWIDETQEPTSEGIPIMAGASLARTFGWKIGDTLVLVGQDSDPPLVIRGIFESGGDEDIRIFAPLAFVQTLTGRAGKISRLEVSAITTPENDLARQAARNPKSLSVKEWDTWYCTAYVGAIAFQIEEAITDSRAKPVRQVAESEGTILKKTQALMLLITLISLIGTALGISNLVSAGVIERSREMGLMKALGATDRRVASQVVLETGILGLLGGLLGYGGGIVFAQMISWSVFGSGLTVGPVVPVVAALMVAAVTLAGSLPATRGLLSVHPAEVLHGR